MPVKARIEQMKRFADGVKSLAHGGLLRSTARAAGGAAGLILGEVADLALDGTEATLLGDIKFELAKRVNECFFLQSDPDGHPWAPRITRYYNYRDSNPILFDLHSSISYRIDDSTVVIESDKHYAFYHQTGTSKMVPRRWHPDIKAGKFADALKLLAIRKIKGALSGYRAK